MYKRIASIGVEVSRIKRGYKDEVTIVINSYSTQILKMHYVDYEAGCGVERSYYFNSEYYSRTRRNHQIIARAFLLKCKDLDLDELHENALVVFGTARTLTKVWYNLNTQI